MLEISKVYTGLGNIEAARKLAEEVCVILKVDRATLSVKIVLAEGYVMQL